VGQTLDAALPEALARGLEAGRMTKAERALLIVVARGVWLCLRLVVAHHELAFEVNDAIVALQREDDERKAKDAETSAVIAETSLRRFRRGIHLR
jgi:hypothetical protein